MKKKTVNKNKKTPDSLYGFFATLGLLLLTIISYDSIVYKEGSTTRDKVFQTLLKALDDKYGREYVFGFLALLAILFGISALRGYLKEKEENKNNDNQS